MNTITKYENSALGLNLIVATDLEGNRWFVAKQIADALLYSDPSMAYKKCKSLNLLNSVVLTELNKINNLAPATKWCSEGDVNRMIMGSEKPEAEAFKDWVCDEVLPAVRKGALTQDKPTLQLTLSDLVAAQRLICDDLRLPESGRLMLYGQLNAKHGNLLALPAYGVDSGLISSGSSRPTKPISDLLKANNITLSATKANKLLESAGFLEHLQRKSSSSESGFKPYWSVSEAGLKFGKNVTNPSNPRETQPHWFTDSFMEMWNSIG